MNAEQERLRTGWREWTWWGRFLGERARGTVREDYRTDGSAWESFPHDHARARAYRWNEDGLAAALRRASDPVLVPRLNLNALVRQVAVLSRRYRRLVGSLPSDRLDRPSG